MLEPLLQWGEAQADLFFHSHRDLVNLQMFLVLVSNLVPFHIIQIILPLTSGPLPINHLQPLSDIIYEKGSSLFGATSKPSSQWSNSPVNIVTLCSLGNSASTKALSLEQWGLSQASGLFSRQFKSYHSVSKIEGPKERMILEDWVRTDWALITTQSILTMSWQPIKYIFGLS